MKLNDNVYAVVDGDGSVAVCDTEMDALQEFQDRAEAGWDVRDDRVVPVTLIPTADLERLRECERALKSFARGHEYADEEYGQRPDRDAMTLNPYDRAERSPTFGDCRRAAELLSPATHTADEGGKE